MRRNFYYVREVAALLGCTTQLVTRRIHEGEIEASRIGNGRWRVGVRFLRAYAKEHKIDLNWEALKEPGGQINTPAESSPRPYVPEAEVAV